jgi:FAST kinase-like protein, subdomain 1
MLFLILLLTHSITFPAPMVAKVFASLNDEEMPDTDKKQPPADVVDERILNAKTVNGLLSISEMNGTVSRRHALKIVSILAEWSTINRARLTEFENDARFIKLCRTLGRSNGKGPNGTPATKNGINVSTKKITGFRTDDLNTVLGVTGDDEAAKLISSITLPQMVKVMSALAQKKRRSTPLLRSLAFNISGSSEELDMKQCADVLYSMAVLNFSDPVLISRICNDVQAGLAKNNDKSAVVGSILTSLGILKYRDADCLEALSSWIVRHQDICRSQDMTALFLTLATVNYAPTNADELKAKVVVALTEKDVVKMNDWLNHVWALVNLSMASNEHIQSVLK